MNERLCFVISPIGEAGTETRKRADNVFKFVISPPAERCGYKPMRADKIAVPGMISNQVIQHILDDPLVIADLTDENPNVYYELAVRHLIRKPLVQIIKAGEKPPFDVRGMRIIVVDHQDLQSVADATQEIEKQIRAAENKKPEEFESPISVAVEHKKLLSSDRPLDRTIAQLAQEIGKLRELLLRHIVYVETSKPSLLDELKMSSVNLCAERLSDKQLAQLVHVIQTLYGLSGRMTQQGTSTSSESKPQGSCGIMEGGIGITSASPQPPFPGSRA